MITRRASADRVVRRLGVWRGVCVMMPWGVVMTASE